MPEVKKNQPVPGDSKQADLKFIFEIISTDFLD
jgi:hypothetical protein